MVLKGETSFQDRKLVTLSDDDEISPKKNGFASLPQLGWANNEFQCFKDSFL